MMGTIEEVRGNLQNAMNALKDMYKYYVLLDGRFNNAKIRAENVMKKYYGDEAFTKWYIRHIIKD